jgi:hypothetical protein
MVTAKQPRRTAPPRPGDFYCQALSEAERADLPVALEIEGVDEEIAMLRLRLRTALAEHPEDLQLMFKGIDLLAKAVATRYRLSKRAERQLADSLANVVRSLGDIWPQEPADG